MTWWMIVLLILGVHGYIGFTSSKYMYYRDKLDYKKTPTEDVVWVACFWPIAVFLEPSVFKGMLYPTLHLWPRFRREWPEMKLEEAKNQRANRDYRRGENLRTGESHRAKLELETAKAVLRHEREIESVRQSTADFQNRTLALEPGSAPLQHKERIEDHDAEVWCEDGKHWSTMKYGYFQCEH